MKKLLSLILVFSLCFALLSCKTDYEDYSVAPAAEKLSVSYRDSNDESYKAFLDKLDIFAAKLTEKLCSGRNMETNVCISPLSVYMALALAAECASAETRDEILNAVGVTYGEVKAFTRVLYAFSNREFPYTAPSGNQKTLAFSELANSIWADDSLSLKGTGIDSLSENYNCDLFSVDFRGGKAKKAIAAYIEDKTHGLINGNIDIPPETLITLINTFYLKEVWNDEGDKLKFTDTAYDFKNADQSVTETKLLCGYYFNGNVYTGDGYTSFYTRTDHGFDIKFIVPTDGHTLDEVITSDNLHTANNLGDYGYIDEENKLLHHTRVLFPEFKAEFDGDIAETLKDGFGIDNLFDAMTCDFSNITDESVACGSVIHRCSLDVNARGIEGAAVTVMQMVNSAGPLEEYENVYHDYIVDRAFGFIVTDSYGTPLFSGTVNKVK